jgi:hypothetical protein
VSCLVWCVVLPILAEMGVAAVKAPDSTLMRSLKDVAAGTVAGIGITLVGHPFGQQLTCSRHFSPSPTPTPATRCSAAIMR